MGGPGGCFFAGRGKLPFEWHGCFINSYVVKCFIMKINKSILPIFWLVLLSFTKTHAQKLLDNTHVYLGFSWQEQDRRLFEEPEAIKIVALENSNLDYETNLYIQKRIFKIWHFSISTGLGYMRYQTKFSRAIDNNYFEGNGHWGHQPLVHIGKYVTHKISTPTSLEFYFDKKERIFLNLTGWASFNFNKRLVSSQDGKYGNKLKLEFNGLELNPGLGFKVSRFIFQFNYRAFNYYKIDKVIYYPSFLNYAPLSFRDKKYESINWDKMWITVGYDLTK